ncbi:DUF1629 domain-containing protein [Comamonas sp. JC664]|uniref:imm11 family protein n=1 Tax=Comamonas sp. JC664 TaxID=2801917 RepID=UPI0017498979|nr:DUF1629 domain-containing protein [Comamonas sp. JC664]MBL0692970.1 hypothetical protein [Comamonas sp. JC664]GHG91531.1 hypothetical protein GCM10012319_52440 [Comamonas sp. KCTC 72670]
MERRFFALGVDVYVKGRWYLSDPTDSAGNEVDDIWRFTEGRPIELRERLRIPIFRPGEPLDIEFAGAGGTPIVSERVASVFRELAPDDVQLFPVDVDGESNAYFLLNATRTIRCIDAAACREVQFFTADEELHAHRAGEYRSVIGLRIDKSKVGDTRVFRTWGWHLPIIVDEEIKDAFEANGIFGGKFEEV